MSKGNGLDSVARDLLFWLEPRWELYLAERILVLFALDNRTSGRLGDFFLIVKLLKVNVLTSEGDFKFIPWF